MKHLDSPPIPEEMLHELDYEDERFNKYKDLAKEARTKEDSYVNAFTAMIHFEELANSKRLDEYALENVSLRPMPKCESDHTFKVEYDVRMLDIYIIFDNI